MSLVGHVVVDSGAFIKNANLKDIGERIHTIPDVLAEIRDKATRERLQVLSYELIIQEPDNESVKIVTDFTKKTGDYPSLSATDIRVMALTYSLEKEHAGTSHLKTTPDRKVEFTTAGGPGRASDIAGFYLDKSKPSSTVETSGGILTEGIASLSVETDTTEVKPSQTASEEITTEAENPDIKPKNPASSRTNVRFAEEGDSIDTEALHSESESEESESEDEDEGWITPKNVQAMNEKMTGASDGVKTKCEVGCLTTDFSMQNVLIQMGLNVISLHGLLIKKARSYVLRCYACFKITTNMEKEFCHHCGNKTLQKVSMAVEEDGSIKYFLSKRLPRKPKQVPLGPMKGGKYANNPILVEDQPMPQQRSARPRQQHYGVFDTDFVANSSPFAMRDTTSRSALLGVGRDFNKRAPAAGRGRKKRK